MGSYASHLHRQAPLAACCDRTSAAIGGGFYPRVQAPAPTARLYRVRKLCQAGEFATVTQALAQWNVDKLQLQGERTAIIEIADSATYHEAPLMVLGPGERLELRAADMSRPVLRVFDYCGGQPERVVVRGAAGSSFVLNGIMIAGGPLALYDDADGAPCHVTLRHCTLVPGWETERARDAAWRPRPGLLLDAANLELCIDHCILGALQLLGGAALHIGDSIIDAGHEAGLAIADDGYGAAKVSATIVRTTVIGVAQIGEVVLAENAIFMGALICARRDRGRVRHSYLAPGSMTPPREHCQPELPPSAPGASRLQRQLHPRFRSLRYGCADYGKLACDCAREIATGADDHQEMGAYHDLHRAPLVLGGGLAGSVSAVRKLDHCERVAHVPQLLDMFNAA